MIKKEGEKTCTRCFKKINLKRDNFVLIGTYNRVAGKDEENFFHFVCFVDWYNQKVMEKARNSVRFMQEKALQLFNNPVMKSMLSQIQGSDQVLSMLRTPLDEHVTIVSKDKIIKRIQNDRKKRSRKNKMQ